MAELWYKNAIFYGVDIKSFCDANGDGFGDFAGLTGKLDYLGVLGVDCLWLLPFYSSPLADNGYDVSDYCAVDPRFGTLDDFDRLVHEADRRGIHILIDLVVNHTSDQHPWFQQARSDRTSRYRDYYVWSDEPVELPGTKPIFPGAEDSVWEYDEQSGQYYLHRFYRFEPDLNTFNPEVKSEILRIMDFWLDRGVAGFRIDAAPYIVRPKGTQPPPAGDRFQLFLDMRDVLAIHRPDGFLLGEADVEVQHLDEMFGHGTRLTGVFNFLASNTAFLALARQQAAPLEDLCQELPTVPPNGQWASFLRNLDELDLERLTHAERKEVYAAFAPDPSMRIYDRGIRRRLAPMLDGDQHRIASAISLLCSLPGTPLIVYGDEIGMGDDLRLKQRNSVRTPMQWDDTRNGGFSTAAPDQLILPVIDDGPFRYQQINLAAQINEPDSLHNRIKAVFATRKACPEIGCGTYELLTGDHPEVMVSRYTHQGRTVVTLHNLSPKPCSVQLDETTFETLLSDPESRRDGRCAELGPYGYVWLHHP